jgi:hypothetical protein
MHEWNVTTIRIANPRRLLSARLDFDMLLRTAPVIFDRAIRLEIAPGYARPHSRIIAIML